MDFEIPEEVKKLLRVARGFVEQKLIPLEKTWPEHDTEVPIEELTRLRQEARKLGLCNCVVPKELGGLELGALGQCLVVEELSKTTLSRADFAIFGHALGPHPALYDGTEYQKEKYLYPVIRGETMYYFAFTEPGCGSDLARMETTAIKDGDSYIINGTKTLIGSSYSPGCHYGIVYAMTDKSKGHRGMSCFLVDSDNPGFRNARLIDTMGWGYKGEIEYKNCVIPAANLLGEEGQGFYLGLRQLNRNRVIIGSTLLGAAERCFDMARRYAKQRVTWGKPLAKRQAIQWMLADSVIDIETSRWLILHAAWKYDQGEDIRLDAAVVKAYVPEAAHRVISRAMQIFGGVGYSKDLPIERFYRWVRGVTILEGSSEVQRMTISKWALRD